MTNESYTALAPYYDRLNAEVDYKAWADFAVGNFAEGTRNVADIACGTGSLSVELAGRGYNVVGVDISSDMLAEAQRKSVEARLGIMFVCQDICALELGSKLDAVTCAIDSINYICGNGRLLSCFKSVRASLKKGGRFIFDATTPYKFENIYSGRDYILETEGVLCAWSNDYRPKSGLCDFYLSLFIENADGSYTRLDERQRQKKYSLRFIEKTLKNAGFKVKQIAGDTDGREIAENDTRRYFVCEAV